MKSSSPPEIPLRNGESLDLFMGGRLKVIQSEGGYRFSSDAVLLSEFVTVKPGDVIVDLGTGCGVIPLILLVLRNPERIIGVEIQKDLASQAHRNARINRLGKRIDVVVGDIRDLPIADAFADVVICNPPYRKAKSGRINPDRRRAVARHEILADLNDVLYAARLLLREKGRVALIYPAVRLADVMTGMRRMNMEPKRVRTVHPDIRSAAKLTLIEGVLAGMPGLELGPPLLGQGGSFIKSPSGKPAS